MAERIFRNSIIVLVVAMTSCSTPMSKESYLKKFDGFVSEVANNHKTYSEKDWQKKDEKYEKFSGEWYEKFKDDFTLKERLKITTNIAKYQYYSKLSQAKSTIKEMLEAFNAKEMKENVQSLVNSGMEAELKQLYEEARKAGKAAEEALTEILNELQVNIDELKKK